jgi:K+-transporting ATPase KdpF subunit
VYEALDPGIVRGAPPCACGTSIHVGVFSSLPAHGRCASVPCVLLAVQAHPPRNHFREVGRGHRIHYRHCGALRGNALDRVGDLAPRGRVVTAVYVVSGVLALGLCVYLLYAMFKPEKF